MAKRTQVDGKDIIERRPAKTPLSNDERTVYYKQVEELVLSDGSLMYGCIHCTFVSLKAISVGSHLKSHGTYVPVEVASMTVEELVQAVPKATNNAELRAKITRLENELRDYKRKLGAVSALFKDEG